MTVTTMSTRWVAAGLWARGGQQAFGAQLMSCGRTGERERQAWRSRGYYQAQGTVTGCWGLMVVWGAGRAPVGWAGVPSRRDCTASRAPWPHTTTLSAQLTLPTQVQSLRKYAKMYDIHGNASNASKEELLGLVRDHFAMQRVEEQEVLLNLASRHQRGGM